MTAESGAPAAADGNGGIPHQDDLLQHRIGRLGCGGGSQSQGDAPCSQSPLHALRALMAESTVRPKKTEAMMISSP